MIQCKGFLLHSKQQADQSLSKTLANCGQNHQFSVEVIPYKVNVKYSPLAT